MIQGNPSVRPAPYSDCREGFDVICDRGEQAKRFNIHYRELIRSFSPAYYNSSSNDFKRILACEICSRIKSKGGRFFKDGKELSPDQAHRKVMKALKDSKKHIFTVKSVIKSKKNGPAVNNKCAKPKIPRTKKCAMTEPPSTKKESNDCLEGVNVLCDRAEHAFTPLISDLPHDSLQDKSWGFCSTPLMSRDFSNVSRLSFVIEATEHDRETLAYVSSWW